MGAETTTPALGRHRSRDASRFGRPQERSFTLDSEPIDELAEANHELSVALVNVDAKLGN
jgi:hypothetical protein